MAYQRQHYSDDAETDKFEDCEEEKCPICGSTEYYVRYKRDGEIIGCSDCISEV